MKREYRIVDRFDFVFVEIRTPLTLGLWINLTDDFRTASEAREYVQKLIDRRKHKVTKEIYIPK